MSVSVGQDDRLTLDQQVCFSLAVAARDVIALYRPILQPLGLTHSQYLVLVTLWDHAEPLCVKDLSRILRTEPPSLSPILKRLAAAGFVQRQRDPTDQRSVLITLTPEGRDLRRQAADVPAAVFKSLGMAVEELESLQQALNQVIAHARQPRG